MPVQGTNSLYFASGIDNSGLKKGRFEAIGIIQGLANDISKINPFSALAIGAVAAMTLIANEGYKMSRSFESAMAEVKTIANLNEKDFKKLEQQVFNLYKTLGTEPPDKLAKGLYEIIGAGFEAHDALKILEIASKSATAGVTTSETAADGLTTILNAFKLGIEDADRVADIMFATVDRGKITFEELSSQIAAVAPLAAASGYTFEEIGGAIATLTKQGVPGSQAITQIRSAIISTNDVLGTGASKSLTLQQAFQKMYEAAEGDSNKLKDLVGRVEAVNGILSIAGPNINGATEDLEAMSNAAGSVDKAFDIITSTDVNQWDIFKNRIKSSLKGIGDAVLEMSTGVVGGLNSALDAIEGVTDGTIKQASEFVLLKNDLTSVNTTYGKKIEILRKLKSSYPEYLSSLDIDKINNENLNEVLKKVKKSLQEINDEHKRRIELSGYNDDVIDARKELNVQESTLGRAQKRFFNNVKELVEKATEKGIEFEFSLSDDPEKIVKEIQEKLPDSKHDILGAGGDLSKSLDFLKSQKSEVEEARKELERVSFNLDEQRVKLYDNEKGYKKIVTQISKIRNLEDLDKFKDFKFDKIVAAVKNRKEIISDLNEIGSITSKQYEKNKDVLKQYLESENNEVKKAAEKRKNFFEFKPEGSGKLPFKDLLDVKKQQFKDYNLAIKNGDDELAKNLKSNYKLKEEDYVVYLRNLYKITKEESKKAVILNELDANKSSLVGGPKTAISTATSPGIVRDIDTSSINAINRRINKLTKDYYNATKDAERKVIAEKIKSEQKKLDTANKYLKKEKKIKDNFFKKIQTLSTKGLREEKRVLLAQLKNLEKNGKRTTQEYQKILDKVRKINEEIGEDITGNANKIAESLSGLSDIFSNLGDEDTAKLLEQLSGVASGVGKIASGDIVGGAIDVLKSALTVEIVSDTEKFEKAIESLEKAIDKLDYVISRSIGGDKISNRKTAIKDLIELQKQAELAHQAELKARKEVKFLGITIGKKGQGSGTSAEKLEELENKAEEARRKVEELKDQLNELYTGTTRETIVDSIISGLKEGKRTVADFADDFKSLIQDALLQAFQIKYLEKEIDKFYKAFAEAGADGGYSAEELNALRNLYETMIKGAEDDIDAIHNILQTTGLGGFSNANKSGLSGAISNITEESANIIAGVLNSMRLDISRGLEIAISNNKHLEQIVSNTSHNHHLKDVSTKLTNIESLLST